MAKHKEYSDNVFINCPFDAEYQVLFDAIVFTVCYCGFIPRSAKEEDDAIENRFHKIQRIIDECKYGIHDISRVELDKTTKLPRFNMPLELGLFYGAHRFSSDSSYHKEKRAMIMDSEPHRYDKFISDLKGIDIQAHNNEKEQVIEKVRNFFATNSRRTTIPGGSFIFDKHNDFEAQLPPLLAQTGLAKEKLTFREYVTIATSWIKFDINLKG